MKHFKIIQAKTIDELASILTTLINQVHYQVTPVGSVTLLDNLYTQAIIEELKP